MSGSFCFFYFLQLGDTDIYKQKVAVTQSCADNSFELTKRRLNTLCGIALVLSVSESDRVSYRLHWLVAAPWSGRGFNL